jgi:hypothetical protein
MPGTNFAMPFTRGGNTLGTIYPGGAFQIVSNSLASPTVVTTLAPHGLATGDTIFWTASTTSNPLLTATPQTVVIVLSPTTFSLTGINCGTAGTAGAYHISVTAIPVTAVGVPAVVTTGSAHGLRPGDTVTLVATGASCVTGGAMDTTLTVATVPSTTTFTAVGFSNCNTPGSATAGHYSKVAFSSDTWDTGNDADYVGLVITSVINTGTPSTKCDIQGGFDGINWFNTAYATMAAPQTLAVAQLTIASATVSNYKLAGPGEANFIPYRFVRLRFTTSADILISATLNAQVR